MTPIWKDYIVTLGETIADSVDFFLQDDDGDISVNLYSGRAYTRPGQTIPVARINDLVASQLKRGLTVIGETDVPYFHARIQVGTGDDYQYSEEFYADWSYDTGFNYLTDNLNVPICDILLPGQYVPCTLQASATAAFTVTRQDLSAGDYNGDFNIDFLIYGEVQTPVNIANGGPFQTAWLNLRSYSTATAVSVNGNAYKVGGGCRQYALYYVNAYGGWDTMAVFANTKESDAVTHYTTGKEYNNAHTYARGRTNFVNELQHKYVFNTHWLTLAQSERMHHLLNSPLVYLHDVGKNVIRPIVLTGTTTEYKRDGRLYQYTIEADLAQDRMRR